MLFIMTMAGVICISFLFRFLCERMCGCTYCGLRNQNSRHPLGHRTQYAGARAQAMVASDAIQDAQLEKQRQERRLWYIFYLKAYTTVLTKSHFEAAEKLGTEDIAEFEEGVVGGNNVEESTKDVDSGDLQDVDLNDSEANTPKKDDDDLDDSPPRMMTLWDSHDTTFRCMEANCCICMGDYEPGDSIVQSAASEQDQHCIHVFHSDCMLQWLSQGKKRCPICRHWFVPAIRIKTQMKQAHVLTHPSSMHHLYDATSRNALASIHDDTDSNMSRSSQGDDEAAQRVQATGAVARLESNGSSDHEVQEHANQPRAVPDDSAPVIQSSDEGGNSADTDLELGQPDVAIEVPGW